MSLYSIVEMRAARTPRCYPLSPVVLAVLLVMGLLAAPRADAMEFDAWLLELKAEARAEGISDETLRALDGLQPDPRVIGFDRRQPEFVQTFDDYLAARVDPRIEQARERFEAHGRELKAIADTYGVDPEYLVAFWGLESSFGRYQGKYSIVRSLATLAHDPRRSAFFRRELLAALLILDEGHVAFDDFVGGWAGAMGQNQFLPSTFLNYAVDHDRDGRKNIWSSRADVWASIANYLERHHWTPDLIWGLEVTLPEGFDFEGLRPAKVEPGCRALRHHSRVLTSGQWRKLGVEFGASVGEDLELALIEPADGAGDYLVTSNFRTILAYNCANKYAVSVGLLADAIKSRDR